ncbi:MAG: phenylacetate--CoA ligase [Bacteroidota bacterium]
MMYNPEIETLHRDKLRQLQNERLQETLQRVYTQVPFYQKQFKERGLKPADIKGVEDLHKLPFTKKDDLRAHYPFGLFAVPQKEVVRIHASSGTTGKPTVVGYNRHDLAVFDEVIARSLVTAGAKPGMKLHNAYGYGLFTGGLGMHGGATQLGMAVIPVSGGMTERQLMILQDFRPEVICCTPSYAQTLGQEMQKRGIDPNTLALRYAILGAEPWTEAIRSEVEQLLPVSATNIYGLSEIIGPGVSQEDWEEKGSGSYIWEDHFFPEVVDKDTGEPLPYGQEGVLVFTTLTKQALPILRYWTNDICSIYYDPDAKRTHIKMSSIKGRADDMLIIRGVNLFHTQVEVLLEDFAEVTPNYQLIVSREGTMDQVKLALEVDQKLSSVSIQAFAEQEAIRNLSHQVSKRIKDNIGLSMQVELLPKDSIPRSAGGKLSRINDLRK